MLFETAGAVYSLVKHSLGNRLVIIDAANRTKVLIGQLFKLAAYIWFSTVHDIFKLDREVPKTLMSGETSDISQFCELT